MQLLATVACAAWLSSGLLASAEIVNYYTQPREQYGVDFFEELRGTSLLIRQAGMAEESKISLGNGRTLFVSLQNRQSLAWIFEDDSPVTVARPGEGLSVRLVKGGTVLLLLPRAGKHKAAGAAKWFRDKGGSLALDDLAPWLRKRRHTDAFIAVLVEYRASTGRVSFQSEHHRVSNARGRGH